MARRRGGVVTTDAYKAYDWRPDGRDGESKKPAARTNCDASEILSRRSPSSACSPRAAGLPCRTLRNRYDSPPRNPGRSPRSDAAAAASSKSSPRSLAGSCDYRQCDSSEKFLSRVSSAHSAHELQSNSDNPYSISQRYDISSRRPICLRHDCTSPGMEAAGIVTRNMDYPWPPEMHSIVRLDSYVKHQGLYNRLGQMVKESFRPRPGDAVITKMPRQHAVRDSGYVQFFTAKHEGCHLCPGDLLLRVGKFVERNTWRYNKRHKLYLRTNEHHWLLIGMVDNFVNLLPAFNHGSRSHVDHHCRFFFPRRGDMIIHIQPPDVASQLAWFTPKTQMAKGDLLVRMYLGEPRPSSGEALTDVVEGSIEIYLYAGKGLGWVFMGRDDCWYKDKLDLLDQTATS